MGKRALAGTREAAQPCRVCRHARIRHLEHGTGPCAQVTTTHSTEQDGTVTRVTERCRCLGFSTDERIM